MNARKHCLTLGFLISVLVLFPFGQASTQAALVAVKTEAASARASASSAACVQLTQFTWIARVSKRTLERIGKAEKPTSFCEPLYVAGRENVLLEIRDKSGKVSFARKIFLNLQTYYDGVGKDGKTVASIRNNDSPSFTTYIPWDPAQKDSFRLRLSEVKSGKLLAEGAP